MTFVNYSTKVQFLWIIREPLCSGDKTTDVNPAHWEIESHALALNDVYPMNNPDAPALHGTLSDAYIAGGQKITDV